MRNTEEKKEALLAALEKSLGVVTVACRACGVTRERYYTYMKKDPEFRASVEELNTVSLDFAESKLFELIKNGNPAATIFYLKTKGKARGYVELQQHDVNIKEQPLFPHVARKAALN